jgi:hypothetical protein
VEELFSDERNHLLSLCGMVNTHSAAGRMTLMNLANYHQYERELRPVPLKRLLAWEGDQDAERRSTIDLG